MATHKTDNRSSVAIGVGANTPPREGDISVALKALHMQIEHLEAVTSALMIQTESVALIVPEDRNQKDEAIMAQSSLAQCINHAVNRLKAVVNIVERRSGAIQL